MTGSKPETPRTPGSAQTAKTNDPAPLKAPPSTLSDSKAFCLMPWVHAHIDTRGRVTACCNAPIVFGNINKQPLDEIWQGEAIQAFRRKMLADEPDPRCAMCYQREAAGVSSLRQETLATFTHHLPAAQNTETKGSTPLPMPVSWDIRFSNVCNFRCRTCWHGASSRWYDDAKALKNTAARTARIDSIQDLDAFFASLDPALEHAEEFYFAGGEPLLMEPHYRLLERLLERGKTDVHLRYNTNFSQLTFRHWDVLDLWQHFPHVTVGASLDATDKRGEYLRKEQRWSSLGPLRARLAERCPHVALSVTPTVSLFNAWHLPDLHRELIAQGWIAPHAFTLNLLHRPSFYHVRVLPAAQKADVDARWKAHLQWLQTQPGIQEHHLSQFHACLTSMHQEDWTHLLPTLRKHTHTLDTLRNEHCLDAFPELQPLLSP